MRTKSNKSQIEDFLFQHKIVKGKIQENIKGCIGTSGGSIPECFLWDDVFERFIKPVDQADN